MPKSSSPEPKKTREELRKKNFLRNIIVNFPKKMKECKKNFQKYFNFFSLKSNKISTII